MVRNTACEGSDGCAVAVLERLVLNPQDEGGEMGKSTLAYWLDTEAANDGCTPVSDRSDEMDLQGPYPAFVTGGWRFIVRTQDHQLIGDLEAFVREIAGYPRSDLKFTSRLLCCTEEGRLGGWAWEKERVEIS